MPSVGLNQVYFDLEGPLSPPSLLQALVDEPILAAEPVVAAGTLERGVVARLAETEGLGLKAQHQKLATLFLYLVVLVVDVAY